MTAQAKTVLVVDDEEALRTLAARLIARRGHAVLTASSGSEALDMLDGGTRVDLVVLDVMMAGLDGLETLDALRQHGHRDLPVVLLTAQSDDDHILGGYRRGADCYLTKPLQPSALLNVVDYLIGDLSPEERARLEPLL